MEDVRCQCGKIVAQLKGNVVVIKCRHCKRFVVLNTRGLEAGNEGKVIEYRLQLSEV